MKNLAFFGGGNIAQSIIKGLINSGYNPKNIFFVDRNDNNQKVLKKLGIKKLADAENKIDLKQAGFSRIISLAATNFPLLYGILAVILSGSLGWLISTIFRRLKIS